MAGARAAATAEKMTDGGGRDDDVPAGAVALFTDGACRGNPGPGGWAALLRWNGRERVLTGGEAHTTNNRMELMAAIAGLEALRRPTEAVVVTDSVYLRDGITRWIHGWRKSGWRTAGGDPVKNADLWRRLADVAGRHAVTWRWVRGHSGHPENTRVDALARAAVAAAPVVPMDSAARHSPA